MSNSLSKAAVVTISAVVIIGLIFSIGGIVVLHHQNQKKFEAIKKQLTAQKEANLLLRQASESLALQSHQTRRIELLDTMYDNAKPVRLRVEAVKSLILIDRDKPPRL